MIRAPWAKNAARVRELLCTSRAYVDCAGCAVARPVASPATAGVPLLVGLIFCFGFALVEVVCFGLALVGVVFCFVLGVDVDPGLVGALVLFVSHVWALAFGAPRVVALPLQDRVDALLGTVESRNGRP